MKYLYLFFLALIIPAFGIAQFEQSIDIVGGIGTSFRSLQADSGELAIQNILDRRQEREISKTSWQIGFHYNRKLTEKLRIRTGFRFASLGYDEQYRDSLRWGTYHDGQGVIMSSGLQDLELRLSFWMFELPMLARWEMNAKKLSPFIEFGALPSFYVTSYGHFLIDGQGQPHLTERYGSNVNSFHLASFASVGVNYLMNEKLQAFIQPNIRYYFTNTSKGPIKEKLYSYGLELGLRKQI